jgi:8-oxo-dGTP diphosphatase
MAGNDVKEMKPTPNNISLTIGTKKHNSYVERHAAGIITKKDKHEIIIIYVANGDYYKLLGGGIEAGEDHKLAGEREVLEETGCKVMVESECIGTTEEWRNDLHQISYWYRARLMEDTGQTELTKMEIGDGLKHEWVTVDVALAKMKECKPASELGAFIKERDSFLLSREEMMERGCVPV